MFLTLGTQNFKLDISSIATFVTATFVTGVIEEETQADCASVGVGNCGEIMTSSPDISSAEPSGRV